MDTKALRITTKIAQITRRSVDEIRSERSLRELVHDSFALVEMAVELQEEFGVQMSGEDFATIVTVKDLTSLISARMPAETG